ETVEWMATPRGITVKAVTVKTKSMDWRDERFLGYRPGVGYGVGDRGSVVLVQPLPRQEVLVRLDLFDADEFTRATVLDRHSARWKEWYGVDCPAGTNPCVVPEVPGGKSRELKELAATVEIGPDGMQIRHGRIDVPSRGYAPEPMDNLDTRGAVARYDSRKLELHQVPDPLNLDREYFEVWLEHADGSMRRVAGDIDIV